jgi:hypothetical protein
MWYSSLLTGSHSAADSSQKNGHGQDSTVSVDETTDSGRPTSGFVPDVSQVDENSEGELNEGM